MKKLEYTFKGTDVTEHYKDVTFQHIVEGTRYNFSVVSLNDIQCSIRLESPNEYQGACLTTRLPIFALSFGAGLIHRDTRLMSDGCKKTLYSKIEEFHNIIEQLHSMKGWYDLIEEIKNKKKTLQVHPHLDEKHEESHNEKLSRGATRHLILEHYRSAYVGVQGIGNFNVSILNTAIACIARRFE